MFCNNKQCFHHVLHAQQIHLFHFDIYVWRPPAIWETNQACEQNGKLTIYIIETTKKLANSWEYLESRLVLISVNYFRNV